MDIDVAETQTDLDCVLDRARRLSNTILLTPYRYTPVVLELASSFAVLDSVISSGVNPPQQWERATIA
jgi:hypothetical protein